MNSFKEALIEKITRASSIAFTRILEEKPAEKFFSFALLTFDDVLSCYAYANSMESHERTIQNNNIKANSKVELEYKWSPQEWEYACLSVEAFDEVYKFSEKIQADLQGADFYEFKLDFLDCMMKALEKLEAEGVFGKGEKRKEVTLFITLSDSFMAEEVEKESRKRLNPLSNGKID